MSEIVVESSNRPVSNAGVEEKFKAALSVIRSLPKNGSYKPSPEMMLKFYSYYKQATEGPCKKTKPWAWDVINKAKWDAWSRLGDMSKAEAMEKYVQALMKIVEAMPASDNVQNFIELLGNFYQVVEIPPPRQYEKYSKMTSTPMRDLPTLNGNGIGHNGMNGHDRHSDMNDSSASETVLSADIGGKDPLSTSQNSVEADGDVSLEEHEQVASGNESNEDQHPPSDSEDEFCDTAEEIGANFAEQHPSLTNSYTMVNSDGILGSGSSSKSDSLSTLDETFDGESNRKDKIVTDATEIEAESQQTTTSTVKVRTRGGEYGARGADNKTSSSSQRGTSHSGGQGHGEDERQYSAPPNRQQPGGGPGRDGKRPPVYSYSEVQDQIATTLMQLQQDMNSVLNRLTILEALTVGQQARRGRTISDSSGSPSSPRHRQHRDATPSWWPFPDLSPKTAFFIIMWPFVVRWIIYAIRRRRHVRR